MTDEPTDRRTDSVLDAFDYGAIAKRVLRNSPPDQLPEGWYVGPVEIQLSFNRDDMPESCKVRKPGILEWDGHTYQLVKMKGCSPPWKDAWGYDDDTPRTVCATASIYKAGTDDKALEDSLLLGEMLLVRWRLLLASITVHWTRDE